MTELGKKARILCVLQYLKDFSDENHPLSSAEILERLEKDGIVSERKAIYSDVEILRELDYDICLSGGKNKGYYLNSRRFAVPEVTLLVDAVQAAGFIPKGQTKSLVEKLEGLVSVYQAEKLKSRVCIENRAKSENDGVYRIIEELNNAILNRKAIKISYVRNKLYDSGAGKTVKEITVSPYALLWDSDRYYLIGNNPKYDNLMNLRVDRIQSVTVSKQPWRHFGEVCEYKQRFDTADYARKTFNMFDGEKCRIDLECNVALFDRIIDRFGNGIFIRYDKDRQVFRFTADAMISEGLIGWLMQFGGDIKVLSPEALKNSVEEKATEIASLYSSL